jgi:hypothetical protein
MSFGTEIHGLEENEAVVVDPNGKRISGWQSTKSGYIRDIAPEPYFDSAKFFSPITTPFQLQ